MAGQSRYQVKSVSVSNAGRAMVAASGVGEASPRPAGASARLPVAVSRSQAYYWKRSWQDAEREALAEIESGHARTFSGADAAIRYLLGPDDD